MSGVKGRSGGARKGSGPKRKDLMSTPCRVCGGIERYVSTKECKQCARRRQRARNARLCDDEDYKAKNKARNKKDYHVKRKHKNREYQLMRLYGLSLSEYEAMLIKQDHSCFICKKPQAELKYALAVDHCHLTDKVRGLLCPTCNNAVAMVENYGELVAIYLEIFK